MQFKAVKPRLFREIIFRSKLVFRTSQYRQTLCQRGGWQWNCYEMQALARTVNRRKTLATNKKQHAWHLNRK